MSRPSNRNTPAGREGERFCGSPELKAFIDRVIVPALLERFLRDQAAADPPVRPAA